MKRSLLLVGLALISLILVFACGKTEEPAKAPKPTAEQKAVVERKPVAEQKPASEQRATDAKEAPVHKGIEHKEPAMQEHEEKEPGGQDHKKLEPTMSGEKHEQKPDLNQALLAYLAKTGDDPKYADPHQTALIDLNGDGYQDALVLLQNPIYFCGTGGCTMMVFKGTKSGFEFVSRSSLIRGPVLVSDNKTHGWRDLIVEVSGGGIAPKQVALKYTGSKYPLNPSTLPALLKKHPLKGTKVF